MSEQIDLARRYAKIAHKDQKRKWTGEPYFEHLHEVYCLADQYFPMPDWALAVAYLHDVVEDTDVTYTDLDRAGFAPEVVEGVWFLTDTAEYLGNRATRKWLDRHRLSLASNCIKAIKLCDLVSNMPGIMAQKNGFSKLYRQEANLLLNTMIVSHDTDDLFFTRYHQLRNDILDRLRSYPLEDDDAKV